MATPLSFEVPSEHAPLHALRELWDTCELEYPDERGRMHTEPLRELSPQLVRVTLEVPSRVPIYQLCLDALVSIDRWCRKRWHFPTIYDWPIRYEAEPPGLELWSSTAALFARGFGDCEDLACDLASCYQLAGVPARGALILEDVTPTGEEYWHVVTERGDGTLEDPSALLGM